MRILEIGGGLGYFAKAFVQRLAAAADLAPPASYTMFDRSPFLRDRQFALLGNDPLFRFVLGDAQEALPDGSYDLIIANEVAADFEVAGMPNGGIRQTERENSSLSSRGTWLPGERPISRNMVTGQRRPSPLST